MAGNYPNRIREFREARGWTVRDLASRAGIDFNSVFRLETGQVKLDIDRMRRLARTFAVKPSALLLAEDVEFRADERGMAIIEELEKIPVDDRGDVLAMARHLVRVVRQMAAQRSALAGDEDQIGALADLWNRFDDQARDRALNILRVTGSAR